MYSDGDVEVLLLKKERWEFIEAGSKSTPVSGSFPNLTVLIFFFNC